MNNDGIGQGIFALGKDCFRGLHFGQELSGDGLTEDGWWVSFAINGVLVCTERCKTAQQALTVAYKAKIEYEAERYVNGK